jgi:CheY-like chemotaxis protein
MKIFFDILIADDDLDDTESLIYALSKTKPGAQIKSVNNGKELFEVLSQGKRPDLIFLDINMPFKNGFECLKEIKQDLLKRHIPIIIQSGSTSNRDIDACYELGAAFYLVKPVMLQSLVNILQELFRSLECRCTRERISKNDFVLMEKVNHSNSPGH